MAVVYGKESEFFARLERARRESDVTVFLVLSGPKNLWGKLATA
jgi:hypothetical protein